MKRDNGRLKSAQEWLCKHGELLWFVVRAVYWLSFGGWPIGWWEPWEWFLLMSPTVRQDQGIHSFNMLPVGNTIHHNIIVWFSWMEKLAFHWGIASRLMVCLTDGELLLERQLDTVVQWREWRWLKNIGLEEKEQWNNCLTNSFPSEKEEKIFKKWLCHYCIKMDEIGHAKLHIIPNSKEQKHRCPHLNRWEQVAQSMSL